MSTTDFITGWWINWGKGPVLGLTLTISRRNGGILISLLTMFVRLVGNHMWGICRFVLHQFRSSRDSRDGLYHQQQATLRNSSQQGQALWKLATLAWFWRSNTNQPLRRSIPMMALIAFHVAAFTFAGLFTSRIIASSDEALYPPGTCGYWKSDNASTYDEYNAATQNARGVMQRSYSYSTICYGAPPGYNDCEIYAQQQIESTFDFERPCPFANSSTCMVPDFNVQADTGYIDSNKDLGINAPPEHRIFYRKTTTCAVVDGTNWSSYYVKGPNDILPGDTSIYFYFGPNYGYNVTDPTSEYTFAVSNYSRYFPTEAYSIEVRESVLGRSGYGGADAFQPNTTYFNQTEEDLQIIFLVNNAQYNDSVLDSWFFSDTQFNDTAGFGHTYVTNYTGASIMGCFERHQICSAKPSKLSSNEPGCTPLTGRSVLNSILSKDSGSSIGLNAWQWATANRILQTLDETCIRSVILELGPKILIAQTYLDWQTEDFTSSPLPNWQWQTEVINWHNITLANLQRWMIDYVNGPDDPTIAHYIVPPITEQEQRMCFNQRVRSADAMSFNGLGVIIIILVGSFIVATNLLLPTIVGFLQTRLKKGAYRRTEWNLDETLQLQRIAYERAGQGTWRNTERAVPLCKSREKFRHSRHFEGVIYSPVSPRESYVTEFTEYVGLKA